MKNSLASIVREKRIALGFNQNQCGVGERTIQRIENEGLIPKENTLKKIASKLEVSDGILTQYLKSTKEENMQVILERKSVYYILYISYFQPEHLYVACYMNTDLGESFRLKYNNFVSNSRAS